MRVDLIDLKDNHRVGLIAAPVECKLAGAVDGEITGYGSVFGVRDSQGHIVEKSAFADSLAKHKLNGTAPAMLWAHDPDRPIGVWDAFEEDEYGLKLAGRLNLATQDGREAHALLKQGAVTGLSIGFRVVRGGEKIDRDGVRRILAIDLWEVSIVVFPANRDARISGVKRLETRSAFETFLRSSGFPKAAARRLAGGGWPALHQQDDIDTADLIAAVKSATNEL